MSCTDEVFRKGKARARARRHEHDNRHPGGPTCARERDDRTQPATPTGITHSNQQRPSRGSKLTPITGTLSRALLTWVDSTDQPDMGVAHAVTATVRFCEMPLRRVPGHAPGAVAGLHRHHPLRRHAELQRGHRPKKSNCNTGPAIPAYYWSPHAARRPSSPPVPPVPRDAPSMNAMNPNLPRSHSLQGTRGGPVALGHKLVISVGYQIPHRASRTSHDASNRSYRAAGRSIHLRV